MIKYRTGGWSRDPIEKIEIERETKDSVWVKGRRASKRTEYTCYFDSWDEGYSHLVELANKKVAQAERQLSYANEGLDKILLIKE